MAGILGLVSLVGTVVSAMGTIAAGNAQAQAAEAQSQMALFKAKQEEQAADESRAAAQRQAQEHRREGMLAQSQLQARAAASGGGADDPTVLGLGESIAGRSEYGALMETYKGENRARGLEDAATLSRMESDAFLAEGRAKKKAATYSAFGTILGGIGSAYSTYSKNAYGYG